MPFAVNLRSDHSSAESIKALWEACAYLEESPSMAALNYPPHLSLAFYENADSNQLSQRVAECVENQHVIDLEFESLGYFETPNNVVVWAKPNISSELHTLHQSLHTRIEANNTRPAYTPGVWIPHCSLATAIPLTKLDQAKAFASTSIKPFTVCFDVVDCVTFYPVEVIYQHHLGT